MKEVKQLTGGGADVAIEAPGLQDTFENALRCLRPGGVLSSLEGKIIGDSETVDVELEKGGKCRKGS